MKTPNLDECWLKFKNDVIDRGQTEAGVKATDEEIEFFRRVFTAGVYWCSRTALARGLKPNESGSLSRTRHRRLSIAR